MFAKPGSPPVFIRTPSNRLEYKQDQPDLYVITRGRASHPRVRARFTVCPIGLQYCVPKQFITLPMPAQGLALRFPFRPVTMDLQREALHPLYLLFLALLALGAALLFTGEARLLSIAVVVSGGLYFSVSMGKWRGLDVDGHLEHVQRIAGGLFVPAKDCWECFHPPAYYALASLLLGRPYPLEPGDATILQGLALLFAVLSVPLIVGALRPFARGRRELLAYSALVALWPAAVGQSARLGNDGLLSLSVFGALCLLARERFRLAATVAAGAFLVKESAVVIAAVAGAQALVRGAQGRLSRRTWLACLGILACGLVAVTAVNRMKGFDGQRLNDLPSGLAVKNTVANVLLPAPAAFFGETYANPWFPTAGRNHLFNYFGKTALYGEWEYNFPAAVELARVAAVLLVILLLLAPACWWAGGRPALPFLAWALSIAAVVAYRVVAPFANNADFRFVYPTAAFALAAALALARGRALRRLSLGFTLAFLGVSQLFFLLLWFWESG